MATQQTADMGAGAASRLDDGAAPGRQMNSGAPSGAPAKEPKAPRVLAAFGSGGGAAIVFSDFASI